jgi:hypothetical protein
MREYLTRPRIGERGEEYAETCLRLLEHLATSGEHAAIRSEKLSFFPCSRSVLRTSACH